jgi:hypothetical protein
VVACARKLAPVMLVKEEFKGAVEMTNRIDHQRASGELVLGGERGAGKIGVPCLLFFRAIAQIEKFPEIVRRAGKIRRTTAATESSGSGMFMHTGLRLEGGACSLKTNGPKGLYMLS